MKDNKLYTEAGFATFAEYTEKTIGLKERQAYNYIKVLEELPQDFLQENAKLGVTKLVQLASFAKEDVNTVLQNSNIDEITAKELADKLKQAEAERDEKQTQLTLLAKEKTDLEKNSKLAEFFREQLLTEQQKVAALEKEQKRLETDIKNIKAKPAETKNIDNPETVAALQKAKEELKEKETELLKVKKQLEIVADPNMLKFKVAFENLQKIGIEMVASLNQMSEENKTKCSGFVKSIVEGWKLW
jgi:hypothetical protein